MSDLQAIHDALASWDRLAKPLAKFFDEKKHPRAKDGTFSDQGASAGSSQSSTLRGGPPSFRQRPLGEAPKPLSQRRSLVRSSLGGKSSKTLIPPSYTGSQTPERPVDSWKSLQVKMQIPKAVTLEDHQATLAKLKTIIHATREPAIEKAKVLRQKVALHGMKDRFDAKARIGELTLDPKTPRGAANRAYNHAAMLALHDFGIVDYDFRMSDAQKQELTPLVPFMRYVRRRLGQTIGAEGLNPSRAPYRDEFGQTFKDKRTVKGTDIPRKRMRPNQEFIKRAPQPALSTGKSRMIQDTDSHYLGTFRPDGGRNSHDPGYNSHYLGTFSHDPGSFRGFGGLLPPVLTKNAPFAPQNPQLLGGNSLLPPNAAQIAAEGSGGRLAADKLISGVMLPLAKREQIGISRRQLSEAARRTQNPTPAQAIAGNYAKGRFTLDGLPISIETPKGRWRRGTDPDGKSWAVRMPAHYGDIGRTSGADGDPVDVYLGPHAHEAHQHPVFVIDQVHADSGQWDEHKCCLGFPDRASAVDCFDNAFSDGKGRKRRGAVCRMTWPEFKGWLRHGDTTQPLALARGAR